MDKLTDQLSDYDLVEDPIQNFSHWYNQAKTREENPEAMTLATADLKGSVAARIVLFKGLQEGKFSLYGHDCSLKGQHMAQNPTAALVFYWHHLKRQVRISGSIHQMPEVDVERYFQKRGLESQVASAISVQSDAISGREELEKRFFDKLAQARVDGKVTRPSTWKGYFLEPNEFEFFLYREHRLNDRFLYSKTPKGWSIQRLQP